MMCYRNVCVSTYPKTLCCGEIEISEGKLLNKDDAKYLIDQFNKYASWSVGQPAQMILSWAAIGITIATIVITSIHPELFPWIRDPNSPIHYLYYWVILVLVSVSIVVTILIVFTSLLGHMRNEGKLRLLMDYWHRHQSLPDDLTFDKIIDSKPKELEALLTRKPR